MLRNQNQNEKKSSKSQNEKIVWHTGTGRDLNISCELHPNMQLIHHFFEILLPRILRLFPNTVYSGFLLYICFLSLFIYYSQASNLTAGGRKRDDGAGASVAGASQTPTISPTPLIWLLHPHLIFCRVISGWQATLVQCFYSSPQTRTPWLSQAHLILL